MYSQGNYGPQYGSSVRPLPTSFQQGSPAAPALYQQGPPVPPPYQQGPLTPPPAVLPHGPPVPKPPIQQGVPPPVHVTPPGMLGQPYFNQPLLGSSPMAPSYQTSQHTASFVPVPPITPQNLPHTVPLVPLQPAPPISGPNPPPPRVLPPLSSSTTQMMYRTLLRPPLHGNMQGPQPMRPLPPLPPSGFVPVTPAPYASVMHALVEEAHPPSMPPPPPPLPPSSPPPLPPSPPPPSSPPNVAAIASDLSSMMPSESSSEVPHQVESNFCSDKISDSADRIGDEDKVLVHTQVTDGAPIPFVETNGEDAPFCEVNSLSEDGASLKADALANLPSTPPKPVEEDIVRNIEVLCQFIAKVGPDFENLARTKEHGNPKFAFLFGGEPGSAAAIGHEYFLWMKRKCKLEYKLQNESDNKKTDPKLRLLGMESSQMSVGSADKDTPGSPDLSDMDMEDDVSRPDKDQGICEPVEDFSGDPVSVSNMADAEKELVHAPQSSKTLLLEDVMLESTHCSGTVQQAAEQKEEDGQSSFSRLQTDDFSPVRSSPKRGNTEELPRVFIKDGSPFRLIQDYASDESAEDSKSACVEDVSPVRVSPAGNSGLHEDEEMDACSNIYSKTVSEIKTQFVTSSVMTEAVKHSDSSIVIDEVALETVTHPDALGTIAKCNEPSAHECENVVSDGDKAFETVVLQGDDLNINPLEGNVHKNEDAKQASTILNVDEFGRLVREGVSDSDSDGSHYSRRFGKRGRSPSPQESRWRRRSRSPRRRRDRRSRSRSWSPKKRRSRSKSPPTFKRMGEFSSERMRRDFRGQPPGCFDFLRGKCYRGASCRYLHHDPAPSDASRRNRNKREQYRENSPDVRNSVDHEDAHNAAEPHDARHIVTEFSSDGLDISQEKGKSQDIQPRQDLSVGSTKAAKDEGLDEKTEGCTFRDDGQPTTSGDIDQSRVSVTAGELGQSWGSQEAVPVVHVTREVQEVEKEHLIHRQEKQEPEQPMEVSSPQPGEISPAGPSSSNLSHSVSPPELKSDDPHPPNLEGSTSSSPMRTPSAANLNQAAASSQLYPSQAAIPMLCSNQIPISQPFPPLCSQPPIGPPKDLPHHDVPAGDYRLQPLQLPLPPYPPPNQYQLRPPVEAFPYQSHVVDYHSQGTPPAKPTWTDLPPPPPLPSPYFNEPARRPSNSPMDFHPSQFQQNFVPVRDDTHSQPLIRNHLSEELTHSMVSGFQHQTFPHMAGPLQPSLQIKEFRSGPLEAEHRWDQPFQGPSYLREDRFTSVVPKDGEFIPKPLQDYHLHPPLQEGSRPFDTDIAHSRHPPFPREPTSTQGHSFPGDGSLSLRSFSREDFSSPAKNSSYSHWQQSSYHSQLTAAGSFPSHFASVPSNVDSSFSRYPSGLSDMGSKVSSSTHYNPFASTFEQTPSSSKFVSSVLRRDIGSNYSSKLGGELATGDQYDPLFDSIEPPSNLLRKFDNVSERDSTIQAASGSAAMRAVNDSLSTLRASGSHVPLDVEENNKQKDGLVAIVKHPENDDFDGATTDAEIGIVENGSPRPGEGKNWSPGIANDLVNTGVGEIEIDQVQTSGKSKKSKDSRSMKLFKIAIADFVKEVLKPSWRQGNMSKEAFKTIVKKTVDKVSGAMQSHQIPKSQAKINQYVESSQRKLTKLVMGYVDKYVKA